MRPRRPRPLTAVFAATVAVLGAAAGCGADEELATARAAAGDLSASMLRPQAEDAFSRKGHPIAGRLECSADTGSDDADTVRLACTGMTRDEEQAEVSGRIGYAAVTGREDGDDGLPGRFVGRVGGDEVFVVTCFDCKPSPVVGKDGGEGADTAGDSGSGKGSKEDAGEDADSGSGPNESGGDG